jgi:hypothetical protein
MKKHHVKIQVPKNWQDKMGGTVAERCQKVAGQMQGHSGGVEGSSIL